MNRASGVSIPARPTTSIPHSRSRDGVATEKRPVPSTVPRPGPQMQTLLAYATSALGGTSIAAAWLVPETIASALLGWLAAVLIVVALRARSAFLPAYCSGLVGHALGFHWVYQTVSVAGGFGATASATIFALFVAIGALQFLLIAVIHHSLGVSFDAVALRSPTAVVLSELVSVRLFRWHFGHTQIAFTPFVQVAGIGGAMTVSFLMFWVTEVAVRVILLGERRRAFLIPAALFALSLGYGASMISTFSSPDGTAQQVLVVQGNATLAEKRDLGSARRNLARLYDLTRKAARDRALIVWPEGSIPSYIPADLGSVREKPLLPWFDDGSALLVGAYAYGRRLERYNAAFAVHPDGDVPSPYFKQILIPFGEYMPLSSRLPWLKGLNEKAGVFTAGREVEVFEYPMRRRDGADYTLKVSPLICYEDTVPSLSREATRRGAELLVNLTSDSWFGRSLAPHQHHLIAAFRAIENRRFLVRATNTGLTAVVDPLGRTVARIPPFSEGVLSTEVSLLNYRGAYAGMVGERPWWALLAASLGAILARRGRTAHRRWRAEVSGPRLTGVD